MKDSLFLDPGRRKSDFSFDESVALVFDDMIKRSVPFYFEIQSMIADLAEKYVLDNSQVYDLGCSTATTIALLYKRLLAKNINYVGVDNSQPMLEQAKNNLQKLDIANVSLLHADLNAGVAINNGSFVMMNLVLQFIDPDNRATIVRNIFDGLNDGGCFVLVEKVTSENTSLNEVYIDKYHEFKKRNLYSDAEIARKRESLENILVPLSAEENIKLLKASGFQTVELFFRWFNFCGFVAIK